MSEYYFSGCNHVGDPIMLKYRPQFRSQRAHDAATWGLLDQVQDDDVVIFMGDNFLTPESVERLAKYKFKKALILGNHEFDKGVTLTMLASVMDEIHGCLKLGNFWLTHIPMHPKSIGPGMRNIHSHMHREGIQDDRYINVSMEATSYRLIGLQDILQGLYVPFQNPRLQGATA